MRLTLDYSPTRRLSPLTPWVHRGVDAPWYRATVFDPPLPPPAPGKGYPVWTLQHRNRTLYFVSPEELTHAIDILGRKILPVTRDLGKPHRAVNSHWLSRLHRTFKPWRVREEMVKRLKKALEAGSGALKASPSTSSG
jgi:hypothetical protein